MPDTQSAGFLSRIPTPELDHGFLVKMVSHTFWNCHCFSTNNFNGWHIWQTTKPDLLEIAPITTSATWSETNSNACTDCMYALVYPGDRLRARRGLFPELTLVASQAYSKPHRYFIELLMSCCPESRFCRTFLCQCQWRRTNRVDSVTRSTGRSKQIHHSVLPPKRRQRCRRLERGTCIWSMVRPQDPTAQIHYFAHKLREFDPRDNTYVYNIHCDRRWDSLIGMFLLLAKKHHNISYRQRLTWVPIPL